MNNWPHDLAEQYQRVLASYLAEAREEDLHQAHELGRRALSQGLGVVQVTMMHHAALAELLPRLTTPAALAEASRRAGIVEAEGLAVFEMTHEANTKLRELTEQLQGIIDTAYDAFVGMDAQGLIVKWNKQAEATFGWRADEVLGRPLASSIIPPEHRGAHMAGLSRFLATGVGPLLNRRIEVMALHRDGHELAVELTITPVRIAGGYLFSAFAHDITERKDFERALREKNEELERANQAKDHFLATMSHELRTPLNAILGFTGTLLMKLPGPLSADQEKQLQTIRTSARHLLSLINDLLDLAKIESGWVDLYPEPVVCRGVLEEIATTLRPIAEQKQLRLDLLLPEADIILETDRRALSQILINLVNNAIKFTDQGGIRIVLEADQSAVNVQVIDTGIGISAEDQRKLFAGFVQLHGGKRREGTGLGLHLSQKLAQLLGGAISVVSRPGQGSTFTLKLPGVDS